jgi:hypothetical protein
MKQITQYAVQNYMITTAPLTVNQQTPQNITAQKWEIVLSAVAIADLKCTSANDWTTEKPQLTLLTQLDPRPGYTAPVVKRIFTGFEIDVAIRDLGAFLYRVNFQAKLPGKIIFAKAQAV